ncbi:outer membrane beta-barrel protein [Leeuwenhoekiella aestuarii]|uniref:Outer membrane beta-barrel protein n=1 Tax=Leeuwenhoekiella aestuarii TaxID=2249426 RepID=A0A4Q0NZQ6_9FLAO|nr:carboxypeptidase-like regulatory domain-containing protein [Leeuwenhoekiella aestuarii]RXG18470.1 outer membrane beta-barrel protein [Leeuwenhoekiella aestuarii]RXG19775.1 outer membrane beta-barrel protein [Leeuwenhoekiella aestuarii]
MKYIIPLFLVFSLAAKAQSVRISGTVKDSIGTPLELANIIATLADTGEMESYAISNSDGRYQFNLPSGASYSLVASFLGLAPTTKEISIAKDAEYLNLDFVLMPAANQLDDVEIVYEMPVVVRGDTIVYNTDSFTNGTEQKLGDVLKKLPGVTVDEDGQIQVEGQTVSKVMIEGKDFFDGSSKLAVKNIPADALKKVEVLKNYNEVDQMRGLGNDQNNVAINLKLKEGKKNFWFGEVQGGIGDGGETRYLGSAKLFYYSPKGSINLIGNTNNTGDVPFTFRDYFNFTGGFRNFNQRGGTSFNISDSGLGFLVTQNNRALEINTNFAAANFSYEASDAWDLSGFTLFSDNSTDFFQRSLRNYIATQATEVNTENSNQANQLAMAKFSSIYKPNDKLQIDYDVLAKKSKQSEMTDALSVFTRNDTIIRNPIAEQKDNQPFSLNQNLNAYYTLDDKNIFAGFVQHLYQNEDPFYNAILGQQPFTEILPLDTLQSKTRFDINQDKLIKTNKLDSKIDYYYVINDKSNLNLTVGTTLSRQDFNSGIFQILEDGTVNTFVGDSLNNDVTYKFTDVFLGAHYKFKTGIFTFTPGVTLHNYTVSSEQLGAKTSSNEFKLLPDLFAIAQFKQSESLRLNYQMTADYTDVNNFAEGYVFNNYNRMFCGNRDIENAIFHTASLSYFNFNMFNFTNLNGGVSYTRRVDAIKSQTAINSINQASSPINSNFVDEVLSANGRFQKTFRKWKANLSGNVSYSELNNIVNNQPALSQNFTQNYQGSVETNFKNAPNFEVGYNRSINNYQNGNSDRTFFTDRPFANVDVRFLKGFTFTADWSYYNYYDKDDTVQNEYAFFEASLRYQKPESKWEFMLDGTNLLNVDSLNNDNFNENFSTTTEYFVMPRIVMFSVRYNL